MQVFPRYQLTHRVEMDIGIIGSGHIGSTLARHLAALGHPVSIANSRGPASLAALAADTGATAATVEQAARARDMVIIAVPEKSDVDELKPALAEADAAQIPAYRAQADETARAYFAGNVKGQT